MQREAESSELNDATSPPPRCTLNRFNIYSGLTVRTPAHEFCFDPAKIAKEQIHVMRPDGIFISHESMDHMDPAQVYILQKKGCAKVFCSLAAAVDLLQAFPNDPDFRNSLHPMLPKTSARWGNLWIETEASLHCDYLMPLVFKVSLVKEKLCFLHCFDSFPSEAIARLSKDTSFAVIPLGIAKGVSVQTGMDYIELLGSRRFVMSHYNHREDLLAFKALCGSDPRCLFNEWAQPEPLVLEPTTAAGAAEEHPDLRLPRLLERKAYGLIFTHFQSLRGELAEATGALTLLNKACQEAQTVEEQELLLAIYTVMAMHDVSLLDPGLAPGVARQLVRGRAEDIGELGPVALFFLGVHAQQGGAEMMSDDLVAWGRSGPDHLVYWLVESLGRSLSAQRRASSRLVDAFLGVCLAPEHFASTVVRRKCFFEMNRVLCACPSYAPRFVALLERGLADANPDVRLLAILGLGIAGSTGRITDALLGKVFALAEDPEDDVREGLARTARWLRGPNGLVRNGLGQLLRDSSLQVRTEAEATRDLIERWIP